MHYTYSFAPKEKYRFDDLVGIMRLLRGPDGCPWDREQTHASIRKNLIEEAYEVCEGIDNSDYTLMCEELGDLLLQIVFHADMAGQAGAFTIDEVADGICKKLIHRHPHIFADTRADSADQVLDNWEQIKRDEKGQRSTTETMRHIFKGLPALMRAQKVQHKAAKAGFDWDKPEEAAVKVAEETDELLQAWQSGDGDAVAQEAGDLLFAAVNVVRKCGVDSEETLTFSTDKFIARFALVEELVEADGHCMDKLSLEKLDEYWDKAKGILKS